MTNRLETGLARAASSWRAVGPLILPLAGRYGATALASQALSDEVMSALYVADDPMPGGVAS